MLTGKPASRKGALFLYLALAIFIAVLISIFLAAKNRKDLPEKTAPIIQKPAVVLLANQNKKIYL